MKFIGNLIWIIFGGLVSAVAWSVLALLLCITVVGIPFGIQCFKIAQVTLSPFGKNIRTEFGEHPIANIIWMLFFGWELALGYAVVGIILCITIIGIPFGKQFFKLAQLAILPFGADILQGK